MFLPYFGVVCGTDVVEYTSGNYIQIFRYQWEMLWPQACASPSVVLAADEISLKGP